MSVTKNITPSVAALVVAISNRTEIEFGQVQIRRIDSGFELRHIADRLRSDANLQLVADKELRRLAQFTSAGAFRPLKSAPNLQTGWRAIAGDDTTLGLCLEHLYPGAVADWFAVQPGSGSKYASSITSYRSFTNRQTGMYRITTTLDDGTASAMVRACCHRDSCLKQRLWTVNGSFPAPDSDSQKSVIPCLEPCAILLEFARKIARLEQAEKLRLSPSPDQSAHIREETAEPPTSPNSTIGESDFDAPQNPRRLRFVLEKQSLPSKPQ